VALAGCPTKRNFRLDRPVSLFSKWNLRSENKLLSASVVLLISYNFASALQYVFQAMMRRHLSTEDYGLMNSIFRLTEFLALPITIYITALNRQWAELVQASREKETDSLWFGLLVVGGIYIVLSTTLLLSLSPFIAWYLKTSNLIAIWTALIGTGFLKFFVIAGSVATVRQWFRLLAISAVVGALIRIVLGWTSIQLHMQLSGAIAASSVGAGFLIFLLFGRVHWPGWKNLPFRQLIPKKRELWAPTLATISAFCIFSADLLIVRRFYSPTESGIFAEVMVLARIIFFVISPLSLVVFPKVATGLLSPSEIKESYVVRRALLLGGLVLVLTASALSIFAFWGLKLLGSFSKPEFSSNPMMLTEYLRIAIWCLVPISLCQIIVPALVARRQERLLFEFTLLGTLLPLGLVLFHNTIIQAFAVEGIVGLILLFFVVIRVSKSS
jgi:O-antigen/teichoic acid export membrane protein